MIVKTKLTEDGVQMYAVCFVGKNGVRIYSDDMKLGDIKPLASERKQKRHPESSVKSNNRKSTRGRIVEHIQGLTTQKTTDVFGTVYPFSHVKGNVINHVPENRINAQKIMVYKRFGIRQDENIQN